MDIHQRSREYCKTPLVILIFQIKLIFIKLKHSIEQVHTSYLVMLATKTAAKPTKLWKPATSSGMAVIGILNAINAPIAPPTNKKIITYVNPDEKLPTETKVTVIAIIIPAIPKKFPCLEVSGDERPLSAKINRIPEIK